MTSARSRDYPDFVDALPGDEVKNFPPEFEVGRSGLKRVSGYVQEEFLPQLRGRKAVQIYREMADNSPVIGGFLFAIERLIRQIEWRVEPASQSGEDKANAEFVEQCMNDMSHSWGDMVGEIMSMVTYGWNLSEIVYKKRVGPWEENPGRRSKYTDNRLGWRKIQTRAQETLLRWVFDDVGGIEAMVQMPPPHYQKLVIPLTKSLLFRTTTAKNNPEGRSMLRNAYQPWFFLKRFQEIEAVGVERDLTGLPVAKVPAKLFTAAPNTKEAKELAAWKKLVTTVRRNEQEGIVIPWEFDADGKNPISDFALLTSGGSRQFDTEAIIQRYKTEMLMAVLADFMQVGHEDNGGSYALHTDKTGMFRTALNSLSQSIADVFNRHAIPQLFRVNGIRPSELPEIVPNDVDPPNLTELAGFMTAMQTAGVQWFPDPELEKFLRDAARLPQLDENVEKVREAEQRQAAIISFATQKLQAMQVEQAALSGQMQMAGQAMDLSGQAQATLAGPQDTPADPGDPTGKHAQAQAGEATNQAKIGTAQQRVKLDQEKQKLTNLKKPKPGASRPPNKKIKKLFEERPASPAEVAEYKRQTLGRHPHLHPLRARRLNDPRTRYSQVANSVTGPGPGGTKGDTVEFRGEQFDASARQLKSGERGHLIKNAVDIEKARIDTSAFRRAHQGDELDFVGRWVFERMPGVKRNEIVRVSANGLGGVVTRLHQRPKSRVIPLGKGDTMSAFGIDHDWIGAA